MKTIFKMVETKLLKMESEWYRVPQRFVESLSTVYSTNRWGSGAPCSFLNCEVDFKLYTIWTSILILYLSPLLWCKNTLIACCVGGKVANPPS